MNTFRAIILVFVCCASIPESKCEPEVLLLTPLIKAGKLEEARNLSVVEPFLDDIKSYAGYFTMNNETESHLYVWFIPCTNASLKSAPLIIWLSGGPGITAMYGLFEETGPFEVDEDGKTVRKRQHAWTDKYHMLYFDQPIGTGFSFTRNETHGYIKTYQQAAEHLYEALLQFYTLFPEFKSNDLYIGGESYAGKYVPALAAKIHVLNHRANATRIPIAGLIIASGLTDPANMIDYAEALHSFGMIDKSDRKTLEEKQNYVKALIKNRKWCLATSELQMLFTDVIEIIDPMSLYDSTIAGRTHYPFLEFLSKNETRERIHAWVGSEIEYMDMSVHNMFEEDLLKSVRPVLEELLKHYRILFFNGNQDIIVSHFATQKVLESLHWHGAVEYGNATRTPWRDEDGSLIGHYKVAKNMIFAVILNAGHSVHIRQPKATLQLIDKFVTKQFNETKSDSLTWADNQCILASKEDIMHV